MTSLHQLPVSIQHRLGYFSVIPETGWSVCGKLASQSKAAAAVTQHCLRSQFKSRWMTHWSWSSVRKATCWSRSAGVWAGWWQTPHTCPPPGGHWARSIEKPDMVFQHPKSNKSTTVDLLMKLPGDLLATKQVGGDPGEGPNEGPCGPRGHQQQQGCHHWAHHEAVLPQHGHQVP